MTHFSDRPCAAEGLLSYRYRGNWGWIMIGALDEEGALRSAERSLSSGRATLDRLERWDAAAGAYAPVVGA